ncbi:MAG: sulfurtransferase [SAR202 cluster bacterium]|nr:sulfurtransferase [SAR202 cluster bacterium]|tara:strand:- start:373 stop:1068 length:696 start_codon:yes stop_codon:yes gene_type:complete
MNEYVRRDLLVDALWLSDHLTEDSVRVIEMAQDDEQFLQGHIPGAVLSPTWQIKGSKNTRLVAPPPEAKNWFESVGIGDDTLVVAYDRFSSRDAARLWWVLNYYGHSNVKILDGGWNSWTSLQLPVESGLKVVDNDVTFTINSINDSIISNVEKLKEAIGDENSLIWDVRSDDEFMGINSRGNARVGHVPGAVHLEWTHLVNEDSTFKSPQELSMLLASVGITHEKRIHIY